MKIHIELTELLATQLARLTKQSDESTAFVVRQAIREYYTNHYAETYEEQQAREAAEIKAIFKARGFPDNWDSLPQDEKDVIRKEIELRERAE